MSLLLPRVASCLALTAIAAAAVGYGVIGSYPGSPTPPRAVVSVGCPVNRAQLAGHHFTPGAALPDLRCADLTGAILDGMDLSQQSLAGVHAERASFRHANLNQADLTGADLRGAVFDDAELTQAVLAGVDGRGASFRDANLIQAKAAGARLPEAQLASADLTQASLGGADLWEANLTGASLTQADLSDADLRGASLWWVDSIQASTWSTRIGAAESGVVQVPLLAAVVLLALMIFRTLRFLMRPSDYPQIRGTLRSLAVRLLVFAVGYALIALTAGMIIFDMAGLWITRPVPSLLVTGGVLLLAVVLQHLAPGLVLNTRMARRMGAGIDPPRPAMV